MRNARWMIEAVGVDGFRIDAGRHFPRWVLDYLDQAMFLAKKQPLLDGSPQHVFSFTETGYDSTSFIQPFIRKDINNANLGQVGGNRDALDFNLFCALHGQPDVATACKTIGTTSKTPASISTTTDMRNGSQGVSFAQSHDELGPFLQNVAYAYTLMTPGNAIVYTNASEFGNGPRLSRAAARTMPWAAFTAIRSRSSSSFATATAAATFASGGSTTRSTPTASRTSTSTSDRSRPSWD